jgi:hypothetical protein
MKIWNERKIMKEILRITPCFDSSVILESENYSLKASVNTRVRNAKAALSTQLLDHRV